MIGIYAIRNTQNNILKHFLCQLNTTWHLVLQTATDAPLLTQRFVLSDSRAVVQIINYDFRKILV